MSGIDLNSVANKPLHEYRKPTNIGPEVFGVGTLTALCFLYWYAHRNTWQYRFAFNTLAPILAKH